MSQRSFARNASHTIVSSVLGSALLAILLVVLPRFITKDQFGYYQLYLFYASYLGYLSFGITDGLFLRLSGRPLMDISPREVFAHFFSLAVLAGFTLSALTLLSPLVLHSHLSARAFSLACISAFFFLLRSLLTFVFQAANDASLFAEATVLERLCHFCGVFVALGLGARDFESLVWTDVAGRGVGLGYVLWRSSGIFRMQLPDARSLQAVGPSMQRGVFVSLAAIATVLVTAAPRFAAERGFGVETFAEVSLAFSLQNIVLTVVAPLSLVMLPGIRRKPPHDLPQIYARAWERVVPLLTMTPVLYFPIRAFCEAWLPEYAHLVSYVGALIPVVVFEMRTRVFSIPFLQALHRERVLALTNGIALAFASVLSLLAVHTLKSPSALVLVITAVVTLRALMLEFVTERALGISLWADSARGVALSVLFVAATQTSWGPWPWAGVLVGWFGYLLVHRASVLVSLRLAADAVKSRLVG